VSDKADCAKRSFEAGRLIETPSALTFADGMAVRTPVAEALDVYGKGAERIVTVSDDGVAEAMRLCFRHTHNVAEGAGAAPLAALMDERGAMKGRKVGVILCGGNVDTDVFTTVLSGQTPKVGAPRPVTA
ncbi:MAG: pyridoxal-phosphate dependent enzyme, partial [Pseudomonadota bacterium]